jgi:hypothetical protein
MTAIYFNVYEHISNFQVKSNRPNPNIGYWEPLTTPDGRKYFLSRKKNKTVWEVPLEERHLIVEDAGKAIDPYDNALYMSLKAYTQHREVQELLQNGQTLQVSSLKPPKVVMYTSFAAHFM